MTARALFYFLIIAATAAASATEFFSETPGAIHIKMSKDAVRLLRVDPRKYVAAQLEAFGKRTADARIRLKGAGSFQPIDEKPSFKVELPDGKIHLNNSLDDPSSLNEFIGAHISKRAGFDVPRVSHALVTLNGRRLGLYVVKESFDSPEVELPDSRELEHQVDANDFCRFMALEVMLCHWDGYSLRGNNFHASRNARGQIVFSPSGMDQLFNKPDLSWLPDMTGPLAVAQMATPQGRATYDQEFRKVFASFFDFKQINEVIKTRVEALKPILNKAEYKRLCVETAELCDRIEARQKYLEAQLKAPVAEKLLKSEGFAGSAVPNRRL
jgi:spore coat protein H